MGKYDDIIDLPHWEPKTHQRMSATDRAGQFAPFAALTGYDAMVSETARLTDSRVELDEETIFVLNETLSMVIGHINDHPRISVTWFRRDACKQGGAYQKIEGTVRDVDLANRLIIFREGMNISLDDMASISIMDERDA